MPVTTAEAENPKPQIAEKIEAAVETKKPMAALETNVPAKPEIAPIAKSARKSQKAISAKRESENAVRKLRKSLQDDRPAKQSNKDLDATYRQGMLHLKLQQGKEAAEDFENIVKVDPENAPSLRGLGLAYYFDQKFDLAVMALEKYLNISKNAVDRESVEKMIQILREKVATASATP